MSDAATQDKGVAGMSDAEMLESLTAMFGAEALPDEPKEEQAAEEVEPTAEETEEVGDGEASEDNEADEDTEESEADDEEHTRITTEVEKLSEDELKAFIESELEKWDERHEQ